MMEPIFPIPGSVVQGIVSYLVTRPYQEVAGLIAQLSQVKPQEMTDGSSNGTSADGGGLHDGSGVSSAVPEGVKG